MSRLVGRTGKRVFSFDQLARPTGPVCREGGASSTSFDAGYGYDRNGNLTSLQRRGRLSSGVTAFTDRMSQTTEYTYDANGNFTSDLNRGISSITYNLLNLPARITWSDGSTVSYRYDADGTLLREDRTIYIQTPFGTIEQVGRTAYSGGVTYQLATAGEPAERIDFEGGFITLPGEGFQRVLSLHIFFVLIWI